MSTMQLIALFRNDTSQIRTTLIEIHGQKPLQIICNCCLELQHCCNRSLSRRSLCSLMGHLKLHKCCHGEEAFHDSSHQSLSVCFGPKLESTSGTRSPDGRCPPPNAAVGCALHVGKESNSPELRCLVNEDMHPFTRHNG
jgi:hypothetical protein